MMEKKSWYRKIPKVDMLLETEELQAAMEVWGRTPVMDAVREELADFRRLIEQETDESILLDVLENLPADIFRRTKKICSVNLKPVINGTGTVLHTNLGRAPIHSEAAASISKIVSSYSNLEYNLQSGDRGERYSHFEELLCRITGAEAAMAVNNNAASVLLVLSALGRGGETIVSRGELVEIGGKFRIPDVMEESGTILREVGCTNKTHYEDYEEAVNDDTKLILKVHTSNYSIVGFTKAVPAKELAQLAAQSGIPLVEDLGSGVFINLEKYGLPHEPTVQEAVNNGVDIVCFSGDKLLGGPQAGIIIGKKIYIDRLKKHPLTRALRIDKYTVAVLEQCFLEYLREEKAVKRIPVLRMLTESYEEVRKRAERLEQLLKEKCLPAEISLCDCMSQAGGGSFPETEIPSCGVSILPEEISVTLLQERLRKLSIAVIGRVSQERFLLDARTITEEQIPEIAARIKQEQILDKERLTAKGGKL